MPIRPENRDRYPDDWDAISRARKEAAGWRCECRGECGRPGHHLDGDGRCPERHGLPAVNGGRCHTIILTTAHLNHTPEDCSEGNLMAMCQGCHLHYDREHHRQSRIAAQLCGMEQAGQLTLSLA